MSGFYAKFYRTPLISIWAVNLCLAVITRFIILPISTIGLDEGIYFLIADQLAQGNMPFSVYFDHKPVLLYYLIAVWDILTDDMIFWTRVQQILVAGASGALASIFVLKRSTLGLGYALALGACFVFLSTPFGGLTVTPENFMNMFALAALLIATGKKPAWSTVTDAVILGVLYALMFNINYLSAPLVAGLHLIYLLMIVRGRDREWLGAVIKSHLVIGLGFGLTMGMVLLPIYLYGDLAKYFLEQYSFLRAYHEAANWQILFVHLIFVFFIYIGFVVPAGITVIRSLGSRNRGAAENNSRYRLAGFIYLGFSLVACIASGRFFIHYFILLLPGLFVLAVAFVEHTKQADRRRFSRLIFLFAMVGLFGANAFYIRGFLSTQAVMKGQPSDIYEHIAEDIKIKVATEKHKAGLYVYHFNPILYLLTKMPAPTKYPFPNHHLEESYARAFGVSRESEMKRILASRPGFIVIGSRPDDGQFGAASALLARELDRCYKFYRQYSKYRQQPAHLYGRVCE